MSLDCLHSTSVGRSHLSWVTGYHGKWKQQLWAQPLRNEWRWKGHQQDPSLSGMQCLLQLALLFCMVRVVGEVGCVAALPSAQCYSQEMSAGSSGARVTSCPGYSHTHPSSSLFKRLGLLCFPSPPLLLWSRVMLKPTWTAHWDPSVHSWSFLQLWTLFPTPAFWSRGHLLTPRTSRSVSISGSGSSWPWLPPSRSVAL